MIEKFKTFLKSKSHPEYGDALSAYEHFYKQVSWAEDDTIEEYLSNVKPHCFVVCGFDWENDSFDYWDELDDLWQNEIRS